MSFRAKIIGFGLILIAILGIPGLYQEVLIPWRNLQMLLGKTETALGGLDSAVGDEDFAAMSTFALEIADLFQGETQSEKPPHGHRYLPYFARLHSFNMLLDHGRLLSEAEVQTVFKRENLTYPDFNYAGLMEMYVFWQGEFHKRPGLKDTFIKWRRVLTESQTRLHGPKFQLDNIMILVDTGDPKMYHQHMAFVLESLPWWESNFAGEKYSLIEGEASDLRGSFDKAAGGSQGFHHNRIADPKNWYLPNFEVDEWGSWFSGWWVNEITLKQGKSAHALLLLDFEASHIKSAMLRIAMKVVLLIIFIVLLLYVVVHRFSLWLSTPISNLIKGSEAVLAKDYSHVVDNRGNDEFSHLVSVFNRMIISVGESVKLKETLTKLLSAELADKAAKEGLVLGGQEVQCTIMFTDFAGFSTLTQNMSGSEIVKVLNTYFGELIPILKSFGGFPDKYIGDAIVAIFGAPVLLEDHAERAVLCALEMQKKMREINARRRQAKQRLFEMRIGLNTGAVVAGAIGCDMKLEYTSIGETTNLACRMEAGAQVGQILMSHNTYDRVKNMKLEKGTIETTPVELFVKGYREKVLAYGAFVDDLRITKNMEADDLSQFYVYTKEALILP